jgi:hypothetical protein
MGQAALVKPRHALDFDAAQLHPSDPTIDAKRNLVARSRNDGTLISPEEKFTKRHLICSPHLYRNPI